MSLGQIVKEIKLVYCWPSVTDGGPPLHQHWANASCYLGGSLCGDGKMKASPAYSNGSPSKHRQPPNSVSMSGQRRSRWANIRWMARFCWGAAAKYAADPVLVQRCKHFFRHWTSNGLRRRDACLTLMGCEEGPPLNWDSVSRLTPCVYEIHHRDMRQHDSLASIEWMLASTGAGALG